MGLYIKTKQDFTAIKSVYESKLLKKNHLIAVHQRKKLYSFDHTFTPLDTVNRQFIQYIIHSVYWVCLAVSNE